MNLPVVPLDELEQDGVTSIPATTQAVTPTYVGTASPSTSTTSSNSVFDEFFGPLCRGLDVIWQQFGLVAGAVKASKADDFWKGTCLVSSALVALAFWLALLGIILGCLAVAAIVAVLWGLAQIFNGK